jgi:hypothetical protein
MERFDGHILGAAFTSGHRIVAGRWVDTPLGGFTDVMWRQPDGRRILMASSDAAAAFIDRHYTFDERHIVPVSIDRAGQRIELHAGPMDLTLDLLPPGLPSLLLRAQPTGLRRSPTWLSLADTLVRPILGPLLYGGGQTRIRGTTRAGTREWYAIHDFRRANARATIDGRAIGAVGACPPAHFGFSEFPDGAALVRVTSLFERA